MFDSPVESLQADKISDDDLLLTAALNHGLNRDDVVIQRRLTENARLLGLTEVTSDDASGHAVQARLGDGDPIVERRLVQQMRLQLEGDARQREPTGEQLRQYFAEHAVRFAVSESVRVEHVYFSVARRGECAEHDARRVATVYQPGLGDPPGGRCPPYDSADAIGDPSLWPTELPLQSAADLERVFGAAAAAIVAGPLHTWSGPHRSALGYHLTRVTERVAATVPPFDTVHAAVRLAWLNERAEQHVEQTLSALR